ncbi:MAG: hypothetical protein ACRDHL_10915 [Candidatus Promineifilaceae bacterium]
MNDRREIPGWALCDWAYSAFSTTVATRFLGRVNVRRAIAESGQTVEPGLVV